MTIRLTDLRTICATVCLVLLGLNAQAQVKRNTAVKRSAHAKRNTQPKSSGPAHSASHVSAEMTKGILKPSETKPGDEIALRLKDDVKSNGDVVLKKGATIIGVVRNVKSVETKGPAQSMMDIEWFAPPVQGTPVRQVSIALQSVSQVNQPTSQSQSEHVGKFDFAGAGALPNITPANRASVPSNAALLNMPSVVAVDTKTASSLESNFGTSPSGQLFNVGHSEWITAGGSKQSVQLFSHLSNDTMIASPGKDFEIASGAQMQLLVGVSKQ